MPRGRKAVKKEPIKSDPLETRVVTPIGHPIEIGMPNIVPNMGKIQQPAKDQESCRCGHVKAKHYGPDTDWCNTDKCECQRFNQ